MHNPLVHGLGNLTTQELEQKIIELQRKYFQTSNPSVQSQIVNLLDIYKEELNTKRAIEANRQREDQDNGDNSLDNLINIS